MTMGDAVIIARDLVARLGAEAAAAAIEQHTVDHEMAGDADGVALWRQVGLAARLLRQPQGSASGLACD